ncbi:hypothetical protein BJI47_00260 [Rhodococcus sp. 1168]|nr:hypothetical protein BJI47_00260 [Rhodococcus sp. 1168]
MIQWVVLVGITDVVQTVTNFPGPGFFDSGANYANKQEQKVADVKAMSIVFLFGLAIAGGSAAVIAL